MAGLEARTPLPEIRCRVEDCPYLAVRGATACNDHITLAERQFASQQAAAELALGGSFRGQHFQGLDLSGLAFGEVDLTNAHLGVNISHSDLSKALLEGTHLFGSARRNTCFPAYFNTHCLEKFEKPCQHLYQAVELCRQADNRGFSGPAINTIGREAEFVDIQRLARAGGFQLDAQLEIQSAMNLVWQRYIDVEAAYFVRQYPAKVVEQATTDLMNWVRQHPRDLHKLHPTTVERIVAAVFMSEGYDCEATAQTRDGGFDLILFHRSSLIDTKILVEVKRYEPDWPVGVAIIRQLVGAMVREGTRSGFVVTTSRFTGPARKFAADLAVMPVAGASHYDLELIDYQRLRELMLGYTELAADSSRL